MTIGYYLNFAGVNRCAGKFAGLVATLMALPYACPSFAGPKGAEVSQGRVDYSQNGVNTNIVQHSDRAVIDYQSFSLAENETVNIDQPDSSSALLNRVIGSDFSQINGQINANGQVFLVNQNGIIFGQNSTINTGLFVGSTLDITNENFNAGQIKFSGERGFIKNAGVMNAEALYLVSPTITNTGSLKASERAVLASGTSVLLNLENSEIPFVVDVDDGAGVGAGVSAVENSGEIDANTIYIATHSTDGENQSVAFSNTGIVRAHTVEDRNGEIYITAENGNVLLAGEMSLNQLDVNAGKVRVTGDIHADSESDAGSINVYAEESLLIDSTAQVTANSTKHGEGGDIRFYSPGSAYFLEGGVLEAKGGAESGDGGFIEVSGLNFVNVSGHADASSTFGKAGEFYIDPIDIVIQSGAGGLFSSPMGDDWSWGANGDVGTSFLDPASISAIMSLGTSVTIDTAVGTGGTGNISFVDSLDIDGANPGVLLRLLADGSIDIPAGIGIYDSNTASDESVAVSLTAGGNITMSDTSFIRNGSGSVTLTAGGNIQAAEISSTLDAINSVALTAGNEVVIPDAGMAVDHGISISATSLRDSDSVVNLSADSAHIQLNNPIANFQLNTSLNELDYRSSGAANQTIINDQTLDLLRFDVAGATTDVSVSSGDLTISNSIDLDLLDGESMSFSAAGSLVFATGVSINDQDTSTVDAVDLNFSSSSALTFLTGGEISSAGDLNFTSGGRVQISNIQSDSASNTAIVVNAGEDIRGDTTNSTDLSAMNGRIVLNAGGRILGGIGERFELNAQSLDVETSGSGRIFLAVENDIDLVRAVGLNQSEIEVNGVLTIPDAGISVGDNVLRISADDIIDSDRDLIFQATSLALEFLAPANSTTFNVDADFVDISLPAMTATILSDRSFQLSDINADNLALQAANAIVEISAGGLDLNSATVAIDSDLTLNLLDGSSTLILDNSGLNLDGDLRISAGSIQDSDNSIFITSDLLDLDLQNQAVDLNVQATVNNLNLNNTSTSAISVTNFADLTINTIDSSGDVNILSMGLIGISDSNPTAARLSLETGGTLDITIPSSGLNINGDLAIQAGAITDGDSAIMLSANEVSLALSNQTTDLVLNVDADRLSVNSDTTSEVSIFDANDLTMFASNFGGDARFNVIDQLYFSDSTIGFGSDVTVNSGSMMIPDSGLSATGLLDITTGQLASESATAQLSMTVAGLLLDVNSQLTDINLGLSADLADLSVSGGANLNVQAASSLTLTDMNADDHAISVAGGNVSIDISAGNLIVENSVMATDVVADGVRQGLIDMLVSDGNMIIGRGQDMAIRSVNTVDQSAVNGLGDTAIHSTDQASVYLHLGDNAQQDRFIQVGSIALEQIDIAAEGGDIILDALGPTNTSPDAAIALGLSDFVTLHSFNALGDPTDGQVYLGSVEFTSDTQFIARSNRVISLRPSDFEAPVVDPPVTPPVEPPPSDLSDGEVNLISDGFTDLSNMAEQIQVQESERAVTEVDQAFYALFGRCVESNEIIDNCRVNSSVRRFLSKWTVGGELPKSRQKLKED